MSIPADLIRDAAKALLELPGARACHPETREPIRGVARRYYAMVYLAGEGDDLSWRVSRPGIGDHDVCAPGDQVVEVSLFMAAPLPPTYPSAEVHLASGMVVEREDGTRVMLRYFAMGGELQQWSRVENRWVRLGTCFQSPDPLLMTVPHCSSLALLRE